MNRRLNLAIGQASRARTVRTAAGIGVWLLTALSLGVACQKSEHVKKVTFTLQQNEKPFANEEIAIVPMEGDKILTSDDKRLGLGKTDSQGQATIEFRSPGQYSDYVLVWRTSGTYMMLRHQNQALNFKCDLPSCDLGKVVFEVFEFSGGTR